MQGRQVSAMADATIDEMQARCSGWQITPDGNATTGRYWSARPAAEAFKPPTFTYEQLQRGLRTVVYQADLLLLGRAIAEQDRLRQEMRDAGEVPFDGQVYVPGDSVPASVGLAVVRHG